MIIQLLLMKQLVVHMGEIKFHPSLMIWKKKKMDREVDIKGKFLKKKKKANSFFLNFFNSMCYFLLFFFIFSGFCHTLPWISHGFTCIPHPDPHSHFPLHPTPLGLPSAPSPSTPEPIIQSEVSQKDKDQYRILMHKYGI